MARIVNPGTTLASSPASHYRHGALEGKETQGHAVELVALIQTSFWLVTKQVVVPLIGLVTCRAVKSSLIEVESSFP
jgi:hypothetical protein